MTALAPSRSIVTVPTQIASNRRDPRAGLASDATIYPRARLTVGAAHGGPARARVGPRSASEEVNARGECAAEPRRVRPQRAQSASRGQAAIAVAEPNRDHERRGSDSNPRSRLTRDSGFKTGQISL